jgi:hypothetical protein
MKLRHAAALALVGWYLMVPPENGTAVNVDAPLSKWFVRTAHDTTSDCQDGLEFAWNNLKNMKNDPFKKRLEQRLEVAPTRRCPRGTAKGGKSTFEGRRQDVGVSSREYLLSIVTGTRPTRPQTRKCLISLAFLWSGFCPFSRPQTRPDCRESVDCDIRLTRD